MALTTGVTVSPARLANLPSQITPHNIGRGNLLVRNGDHLIDSATWDDVFGPPATAPSYGTITTRAVSLGGQVRVHIALDAVRVTSVDGTTAGFYGTQQVLQLNKKGTFVVSGGGFGLTAIYASAGDPDGSAVANGFAADATLDFGVGSVASAAAGTLTTTEDDIAAAGTVDLVSSAYTAGHFGIPDSGVTIDASSTTTNKGAYLNFGGTVDADHGVATTEYLRITGWIVVDGLFYPAESVNGF